MMMRYVYCLMVSMLFVPMLMGQGVKISANPGTPDPSSILEVESTSKGFLLPRLTTNQRNAIVAPAIGLMIYNTTTNCLQAYFPTGWNDVSCDCTAPSSQFSFLPASPGTSVPVTFTPQTLVGVSYNWTFQGGSPGSSTQSSPVVSWANTGTYTITLTITDNTGCSSTTTQTITITGCPSGSVTFGFTGAQQTWTVPNCVTSIIVDAYGAQGGNNGGGFAGALGGRVEATLTVVPGSVLNIYVGGKGPNSNLSNVPGGYNGGGNGTGSNSGSVHYDGGGGGGATDIRIGGVALTDRVLVAGGGGGSGGDGCNAQPIVGGAGGGLIGGNGAPGNLCVCNPAGAGGTQSAGGVAGNWSCICNATNGTLGIGGSGSTVSCGGPVSGAGGGGGYYGGGGGGLGGGGGGSSYVTVVGSSNITHTQGVRVGDGTITITY